MQSPVCAWGRELSDNTVSTILLWLCYHQASAPALFVASRLLVKPFAFQRIAMLPAKHQLVFSRDILKEIGLICVYFCEQALIHCFLQYKMFSLQKNRVTVYSLF